MLILPNHGDGDGQCRVISTLVEDRPGYPLQGYIVEARQCRESIHRDGFCFWHNFHAMQEGSDDGYFTVLGHTPPSRRKYA